MKSSMLFSCIKIDPRLNILSAHLKTNEIEAEKFDSFVANEFLKPAKVQTSVTVYIEKKTTNQRGVDNL